jgi:ribulose-5-phosphate 4-epimerase/fuculose-1-phosphate aldolase
VEDATQGRWLAEQVSAASGILLAHHGAIVTGTTIGEACYKAVTFERMCRMTYDILALGRIPTEIPAAQRPDLKSALRQNTPLAYWDGAARQLLAHEPETVQ